MYIELISGKKYKNIVEESATKIIGVLLDSGVHFSIVCDIKKVEFKPELPPEISSSFKQFSIFVLAGYTFESAFVEDGYLCFEAGFGPNNFGSNVSVPIGSILNIIVEDNVIFINPAATIREESEDTEGIKRSLNLLLSNPQNRKFIKN